MVWEPLAVNAPVIGVEPSRNSGSCALPLVSEVTVEVADSELTLLPLPLLSTCNVVPDGFENCRFVPSAALSCDTTALMPAAKIDSDRLVVGLGGLLGSVPPAPSATSVTVCCVLMNRYR